MTSPALFLALTAAWAAALLVLRARGPAAVRAWMGGVLAVSCLALGILGLACVAASTFLGHETAAVVRPLRAWLAWAGPFAAGAAWAGVLARGDAASSLRFRRTVAGGVSCHVALAFFGFEIGKMMHDAEMRAFFLTSGLPLALMYAVLVAETLSAWALLLGWQRRWAASVLAAIMVAAIGTHLHNGDPLGDALDAIRMLVLCVALALMEFRLASPASAGGSTRFRNHGGSRSGARPPA